MRTTLRAFLPGLATALLVAIPAALPGTAEGAREKAEPFRLVREVDPFVGTGGHGHTFPGATRPFGLVQLSPDTRLEGWDGCSGYHADDRRIYGFSHTHLSGTGVPDYADVLVVPGIGPAKWRNGAGKPDGEGYASPFHKETERASPGYYEVFLDGPRVKAELTASRRAGVHRYTFPAAPDAWVLFDLAHRDEVIESSIRFVSDREIEGTRRSRGWAKDQRVHFVARFDRPLLRRAVASAGTPVPGALAAEGKDVQALAGFATNEGESVVVTVGISFVDVLGARRNLDAEAADGNFDRIRREAADEWEEELSRIVVDGGTPEQRKVFYTALYHAFLCPNVATDVDGRYLGRDLKVHTSPGSPVYTVFSLWDTFRSAHPLYLLVQPERTTGFLRTFLAQWRDGGALPIWELASNETFCMIGYHAVSVAADALVKGASGLAPAEVEELYGAMKASAASNRFGLPAYRAKGWISAEDDSASVSKTLEYAYDDWCIAQVARLLGRKDEEAEYLRRAQSYRHLFDPGTGFFRARAAGSWFTPFDPREINVHYTEGNAWQWSTFVPQDVSGLASLLGGREALGKRLDALFTADSTLTGAGQPDVTGLIGQYAHGNEPSHHVPWLYPYVGRPAEGQKRVREILDRFYHATPDGLIGNEDCGQMSAWYVLSALGLYPVTPGSSTWVLGAPLFRRATVRLAGGRRLVIRASSRGAYVKSARWNGEPWPRSFIDHADVASGGELLFTTVSEPEGDWGTGEGNEPRSAIEVPASSSVLAVPYVSGGETRFRGSTDLVLASADPGAAIRCTTDGSVPTGKTPPCPGPLRLAATTTVKARAFRPPAPPSPVLELEVLALPRDRSIRLATRYSPRYSGGGDDALIDGVRGLPNFRLGGWQGYKVVDLDATIDLGSVRPVSRVKARFLHAPGSWIFLPTLVEVFVSTNGTDFTPAGSAPSPPVSILPERTDEAEETAGLVHAFVVEMPSGPPVPARYVRVVGRNHGKIPEGHPWAGEEAFVFADEIEIE